MSETLERGHFYHVNSPGGTLSYCLYVDFRGNTLRFECSFGDGGYRFDSDSYYFKTSEDLIRRAREIPAPQIAWIKSYTNQFTDRDPDGPVFSLTLFPGGIPNRFFNRICSLADVRLFLHMHDTVTLQGIGTFLRTSKGTSCFSGTFSEGLHVLCQDFFQPEGLLAEFGLTPKGVESFITTGRFSSWEDWKMNPGYYECNGVVIPIPSDPKYHLHNMLLPRFKIDEESGCYVFDEFSFMSPCNLMNYQEEMYVGIQVSMNGSSGSPRGTFILSPTFRSCQSISGDRVFWTLDDLLEGIDDIMDTNSRLEVSGLLMTCITDDGRIHMQSHYGTIWEDVPMIKATFLAQK